MKVSLENTATVIPNYVDHSSTVINAKIKNMFRNIQGLETNPQIIGTDHLMEEIMQNEHNPTNLFFALIKHIEVATCQCIKKMKYNISNQIKNKRKDIHGMKDKSKALDNSVEMQLRS
jgi:hypothetical protein